MSWVCDNRWVILDGLNPVDIKIDCYEVIADHGDRNTGIKQYENKVTVSENSSILSTVRYTRRPLNGFVEFSRGSITYYPFKNWNGYDNLSFSLDLSGGIRQGGGDGDDYADIDITFQDVQNFECEGNRVPQVYYVPLDNRGGADPAEDDTVPIGPDPEPEEPSEPGHTIEGVIECVSLMRVGDGNCQALGYVWNESAGETGECQNAGLPDPFFRKNNPIYEISQN